MPKPSRLDNPLSRTYRLSETCREQIAKLGQHLTQKTGIPHSSTTVIEQAVRELARKHKLS